MPRRRHRGCNLCAAATILAADRLVGGRIACIGSPAPVVMPHLGEDFMGSVLQEHVQDADAANFYAEFETELNV